MSPEAIFWGTVGLCIVVPPLVGAVLAFFFPKTFNGKWEIISFSLFLFYTIDSLFLWKSSNASLKASENSNDWFIMLEFIFFIPFSIFPEA